MLREARYPEGDKYLAEYNGPFKSISKETYKAKPGSGLPDLVKTYTYGPCASPGSKKTCGKPASITDPGGHTTNWTYAAAHGGVRTEMKPAPTSGAARPTPGGRGAGKKGVGTGRYGWRRCPCTTKPNA